jgi:hypothetical protein
VLSLTTLSCMSAMERVREGQGYDGVRVLNTCFVRV